MKKFNNYGFTLLEIMIAVAISSVLIATLYVTFASQEKSQISQQQIGQVQQNVRAAMHIMASEIRLAGYQEELNRDTTLGIQYARSDMIAFNYNTYNSDGTFNSTVYRTYGFAQTDDPDKNGMVDSNDWRDMVLKRSTSSQMVNTGAWIFDGEPLAERIQALRFLYGYDTDNDGVIDGWGADNDDDDIIDTTSVDISNIKAVRIGLLGRSRNPVDGYADNNTYDIENNGVDDITASDNYRRRHLILTIQCRNLGL